MKNALNQLIFFANSKCNLRCSHCSHWQQLNRQDDLRLDEVERISGNLPQFNRLLISGGEPFLRGDLPDIISLFHRNNQITSVVIPTNATLTDAIEPLLKDILKIDPHLAVSMCISLDGPAGVHDVMRGVNGVFEKAIESIGLLSGLKRDHDQLSLFISTVISAGTLHAIPDLIDYIRAKEEGFIDMHFFDIVRGSPPDSTLKTMPERALRDIMLKTIIPYQHKLLTRTKRLRYGFFAPLVASMETALFSYGYTMQCNTFFGGKPWKMRCRAGITMLVIDSNGDLSSCELRHPLTNVRGEDCDVMGLLGSDCFRRERHDIRENRCSCTHSSFLWEAMWKDPRTLLFRWPLAFLSGFLKLSGKSTSGHS